MHFGAQPFCWPIWCCLQVCDSISFTTYFPFSIFELRASVRFTGHSTGSPCLLKYCFTTVNHLVCCLSISACHTHSSSYNSLPQQVQSALLAGDGKSMATSYQRPSGNGVGHSGSCASGLATVWQPWLPFRCQATKPWFWDAALCPLFLFLACASARACRACGSTVCSAYN